MESLATVIKKERQWLLQEYKYLEQVRNILEKRAEKIKATATIAVNPAVQRAIDKSTKRKVRTLLVSFEIL